MAKKNMLPETVNAATDRDDSASHFDSRRWADNVCYVLKAKGIPLGEFEKKMEMPVGNLSKFRTGLIRPKIGVAFHISEELSIDVQILEKGDFSGFSEADFDNTALIRALKEDTLNGKLIWRDVAEPYTYSFYGHGREYIRDAGERLLDEEVRAIELMKDCGYDVMPYETSSGIGRETFITRLPDSDTYVASVDDEYAGVSEYSTEIFRIVALNMKGMAVKGRKKPEAFIIFAEQVDGGKLRKTYKREEAAALIEIILKGRRSMKPKNSTETALLNYLRSRGK